MQNNYFRRFSFPCNALLVMEVYIFNYNGNLYQKRIKDFMMANHIILVDDLSVEDVVLNIIKRI